MAVGTAEGSGVVLCCCERLEAGKSCSEEGSDFLQLGTIGRTEESVVADPGETAWEDMLEEPGNEG